MVQTQREARLENLNTSTFLLLLEWIENQGEACLKIKFFSSYFFLIMLEWIENQGKASLKILMAIKNKFLLLDAIVSDFGDSCRID